MKKILLLISLITSITINAQVFTDNWQWANGVSSEWNVVQGTSGSQYRNRATITVDEKGNTYVMHLLYYNDIKMNITSQNLQVDTNGISMDELMLSKYNCNGDLVWYKFISSRHNPVYGSLHQMGSDVLNSGSEGEIIYDNEGSIFFSNVHDYRTDTLNLLDSVYVLDSNNTNSYLVKIDTSGLVENVFTRLKNDSSIMKFNGYAATEAGDLYFIGEASNYRTNNTVTSDQITPGRKSVIGKINKQTGTYDWLVQLPTYRKSFIEDEGMKVKDIITDHDNNIIVAGYITDTTTIYGQTINVVPEFSEQNKVAFIAKYDEFGNNIWFKRGYSALPTGYPNVGSYVLGSCLTVDENNEIYCALIGQRVYFDGVIANPDTGTASSTNIMKFNGNTGMAEWILYAEKSGGQDNWFPGVLHYKNGVLYAGGLHGSAKIDSTIFDASAGAYDPLLVAVNPTTGKLMDYIKTPTSGGSSSSLNEIKSDPNGNLHLVIHQEGEIELAGFDTLNTLHLGRPTGLVLKYGVAECTCTPPSIALSLNNLDTLNRTANLTASGSDFDNLSWNFGDGTLWADTNITTVNYTYAIDSTYQVCVTAQSTCGTATSCINITISNDSIIDTIPNAIRNINNGNWGLTMFPNPSLGNLNFEFSGDILKENKELSIFDLKGATQLSTSIKGGEKQANINLQNLPKGIYVIQILSGNYVYTDKVIKE